MNMDNPWCLGRSGSVRATTRPYSQYWAPEVQAWEDGTAGSEPAERWSTFCISAAGISIAGGTDEVQRNIIGERVLGLPKEPDPFKGAAWLDVPRS